MSAARELQCGRRPTLRSLMAFGNPGWKERMPDSAVREISRRLGCVALAAGVLACGARPSEPIGGTQATWTSLVGGMVTAQGLEFRVASSQHGANLLRVVYTVTNVSSVDVTYANTDCTTDQRLYNVRGVRVYSLLSFQHARVPEGLRYVLAPGARETWSVGLLVPEILANVAVGAYTVTATIPNINPEREVKAGILEIK